MKGKHILVTLVIGALLLTGQSALASNYRLGGGVHYWRTVDNIDVSDIDENGFAWMVSFQSKLAPILKLEANLEIFPKGFGGADEAIYAPQVFGIVGGVIYGGLGAGLFYADGEFADDPFYVLRAGLDFELLPGLYLDINANYHFLEFNQLKDENRDINTDTITLGAVVRFDL